METLNQTEPHYIRCVKPNSLNRPQKFENLSILHQLRCGVSNTKLLSAFTEIVCINQLHTSIHVVIRLCILHGSHIVWFHILYRSVTLLTFFSCIRSVYMSYACSGHYLFFYAYVCLSSIVVAIIVTVFFHLNFNSK